MKLGPGESGELFVPITGPLAYPLLVTIRARGWRADIQIPEESVLPSGVRVRWRRLPVPLLRRLWALVSGRHVWTYEGIPA